MRALRAWAIGLATNSLTVAYAALILATAAVSLWSLNLFEGRADFSGLENYAEAFRDPSLGNSLALTSIYALVASALCLSVSALLAVGLGRLALNPVVICIAIAPWFLPPTAVGVLFQLLLDYEQGPLTAVLSSVAGQELNILGSPSGMFWALVLADLWQWVGLLTIAFALLARSADRSGLDAIDVFGGRSLERLLGWWAPTLLPSVVVLAAVKVFWTFADFDRVSTLTNHGGPLGSMRVFGIWVERAYFSFGDFGFGSAASILVLVTALAFAWPVTRAVLRRT